MRKFYCLVIGIFFSAFANAQNIQGIINDYYTLTSIQTCNQYLGFAEVHNLVKGDTILIIQMKGADINTPNNSSFGSISDIKGAGLYEFNVVDSSIDLRTIKLKFKTVNTYNLAHKVQVVSVPHYNSATVVAPLTCKAWDGNTGGILVFFANTLFVSDSITVSGKGFRGANVQNGGCATFPSGAYFSSSADNTAGRKGEGIHIVQANYENGRGKLANGGGGGNDHNSGGGGGANSGAGGTGGQRWKSILACPGLNPGVGADSLVNYFQDRLFLGGGGGAGHENNNNTLPGGNGGGIVFIKTNSIIGDNRLISARGADVDTFMDGDGGSGGGAGGTVVLIGNTTNFSGISIDISGGNGESVDNGLQDYCSGAGGGGGGGAAYFSGNPSLLNIIRHGGSAGVSFNSTINCNSYVAKNGTMGSIFTPGTIPASHFVRATIPFELAKLNVSKDTGICKGQSVELFLKSCTKVSWTPNTFLNRDTGSIVISTPDSNITYTVKGIDSCGNSRSFNIAVLVDNVKLVLNKDTILCTGQTVSLKINNGTNTIWTPNTFLNIDTGNTVLSSPTSNIKYIVQTKNKCGLNTFDSVSISIKSTSLNMTKDTNICGGKSVVLKISEGKNALWTPNTQINKDTGLSIIASPSQTRKYFVEAFDACSFRKYRDSVLISVSPAMTLNIPKDSICLGDSIVIKANNRLTYTWNNQLGTDQFTVKGNTIGTQTICAVGINATCKDSICFNIKTIKCSLAISNNGSNADIQLYPNPMNTTLNIAVANLSLPLNMTIYDITHRKIQSTRITDIHQQIELHLTSGVYIAVFEGNDKQYSRRFEVE